VGSLLKKRWNLFPMKKLYNFEGHKDDLKLYAALLASQPKPGEIIEWGK